MKMWSKEKKREAMTACAVTRWSKATIKQRKELGKKLAKARAIAREARESELAERVEN